jgi:membrane protein DedA with SNARE-associated domain/rhodanese-related sulfurtransferase
MSGTSQLTYTGIWIAVFARQLCLPVPAFLLLITAGALMERGALHGALVLLAGVLGCLAGDGVWFWMGRRWGKRIIRLLCSFSSDPRFCMGRAHGVFERWGLRTLVVAKFIPGLDGVMPPVAGAEGASVSAFVAFDGMGSLLWTGAYVLLGAVFSNQLDMGIHLAERFGTWLAIIVGVPLLSYVGWRGFRLIHMILHLRLRRISPALLERKLKENPRVAVFDLLSFEARDENNEGIPGAVRIDPARLRSRPHAVVPGDIDIVLYCSSKNELTSARVAAALQKRGIDRVWVLEGGLEAWRAENRPVSLLSSVEEVAERLGIELPKQAA